MKVVLVHNHYQQAGGEDRVFADEAAMLVNYGHDVIAYEQHNDVIREMNTLAVAKATIWNSEQHDKLGALFARVRPDIVHVHNTLPIISPAVYDAARTHGAAVVQTLHNYRLICPSGLLFRDSEPCELCVGRSVPWPGVVHTCYRGSFAASLGVSAMLVFHRARGTYRHEVDRYIALTEFSKRKFVQGGITESKIVVKPNFLSDDLGTGTGDGGYALFAGRLSEEKGLRTLLDAWTNLGEEFPLRILGNGPLREEVASRAQEIPGVKYVGEKSHQGVIEEMKAAALLVFPSVWYETFGLVVIEALSVGTPVVASRLGAVQELISDGTTGAHFEPADPHDLARVVKSLVRDPSRLQNMRRAARDTFTERFSRKINYEQLMDIYEQARRECSRSNRDMN